MCCDEDSVADEVQDIPCSSWCQLQSQFSSVHQLRCQTPDNDQDPMENITTRVMDTIVRYMMNFLLLLYFKFTVI